MRVRGIVWIAAAFVIVAGICGSSRLDIDEFRVIKEPYEMLGGDYTLGYLKAGERARAFAVATRAYAFYWTYRPMSSPIIAERDRNAFAEEERRFGYVKPGPTKVQHAAVYENRLVVPEPDRFYRHGAGAPLFTAVLRLPSLALVKLFTAGGPNLLAYQFQWRYHPIFIVTRIHALLAGLATVLLVYLILRRETSEPTALLGAGIMAAFPPALMYFPNLHYDAILTPLVLAASYAFVRGRYGWAGVCFGLAFASKNSAVLMLPAVVIFVAVEALRAGREGRPVAAVLRARSIGLAWFSLAGLLAMMPFASPVSQVREVLTPVVRRAFDPRGEDVSRLWLSKPPASTAVVRVESAAGPQAVERTGVSRLKALVGYNLSLPLLLIALPLLWGRLRSPFGLYAFCFIMTSFPYRILFGDGLGYRSLMYLPFFAVLAAMAVGRRGLIAIVAVLLLIDVVFLVDPMTANGMAYAPPPDRVERPAVGSGP